MQLIKFLPFVCVLCLSCNSQKEKTAGDSKLLAKVDSLINENRKLSEQLSQASQNEKSNISETSTFQNTEGISKQKYAFVLLVVKITEPYYSKLLEKMTTKTEQYSICSPVKSFDSFNEDIKYQFMDEFQSNYMKGRLQGDTYSTVIDSRQCFAFETYVEASKEREKYLIPQQ